MDEIGPRRSAGGVIVNPAGNIVLVEQHGNSWSFPKGGVEEGESALEAAVREIREEAGLEDLVLVEELGSYVRRSIGKDGTGENMEYPPTERTLFLFRTAATELPAQIDPMGEITASRFVTVEEAFALLSHPKDKEFLAGIRSKIEE
jgi:8-oxo-dGTP pyrophosphatase MutT (NUDIX family)